MVTCGGVYIMTCGGVYNMTCGDEKGRGVACCGVQWRVAACGGV